MSNSDIKIDLVIAGFGVILAGMFSAAIMVIGLGRSATLLGVSVNSNFESYLMFIVVFTVIFMPIGAAGLALYRHLYLKPVLHHA